tara:strand:- start:145 stop:1140 length:996 start_codon:yes stop_codon:yes gene_type:complete
MPSKKIRKSKNRSKSKIKTTTKSRPKSRLKFRTKKQIGSQKSKISHKKTFHYKDINKHKLNEYKNYLKSLSPLDREKLEFNLILLFMMLMIIKMENKQNLITRFQQLKRRNLIENKYKTDDFLQSYNNFKKCFSNKKNKKSKSNSKNKNKKGSLKIKKGVRNIKNKIYIKGGAYLQRLEDLADKPITGNDLKKSLDEITDIIDSLKYTPKGSDMKPFSMFLNLFRGNDYDLNYRLKMQEAPQYFEYMPPSLNIKNILNLLPDLVEYITIYKKHRKFLNEYLVSIGQLREEDIKPTELEEAAQKFQDAKDTFDANLSNITNPKNAIKRKMLM